ncbi:MAG: endonuclease [Flavobacterium sp.]|nr:endonuclease [Flavobacterium sp.]
MIYPLVELMLLTILLLMALKGSNLNSGYSTGYTGIVFEPIDEFKGDIARCLLYFATRYEDEIKSNRYTYTMFDGTSTQVFTDTFKNILLTWNAQDPVSTREIARNNAIYARQKNRNPYIDNNTYVTKIWGSAPGTNSFELVNAITVFPNPSKDSKINIQTELPLDEISLVTINGQLIEQVKKPYMENNTYTIKNLNSGFYFKIDIKRSINCKKNCAELKSVFNFRKVIIRYFHLFNH